MTARDLAPLTNEHALSRHAWHPVAFGDEVTGEGPVQVWVAGEPWVLVRLDDTLVAFADQCPHRLAPMSAGRVVTADDGTARLACGYHGWRYGTDGQCDLIPALGKSERISRRAALAAPAGLTEAYGMVWLAPETPLMDIPAFPEWTAPGVTTARATTVRTAVGAGQLVDNFLDAAHFPYVHAASFGVDDGEPLDAGAVTTEGSVVTATFGTAYRDGGEVLQHTVTKTAGPGFTVHLRLELGDKATLGILFACVPERSDVTRVVKLLARDDLHGDPAAVARLVKEEDQILAEDLVILEQYPSRGLPLDPRAELHTRSDKLSLAWRTVMADAVRSLGEG